VEGAQVIAEEVVGVLDAVGVLADDPDDCGFCLWFVELVDLLDDCADDAFVLVGVFAEDVADHHGGFLNDVWDLGFDQLEQGVDALTSG